MARKKKGGGIEVILYLILLVVAVITPIVLMIGFIYNWYKTKQVKQVLSGNISDFWLDSQDKDIFKQKHKQLISAINKVQKAEARGRQEGVSLNKDGSFSARSNVGKEIRLIIDQTKPIIDELSSEVEDLAGIPLQLWDEFNLYVRREYAFLYSLYVWFIAAGSCSIYVFVKQWKMDNAWDKIAIISAVICIISYFIFRNIVVAEKGAQFSPRPPEVSIENVGAY